MTKLYIHELIDVIGHNRTRYQHHMTANWCPQAREERDQLCYGVWSTIGSTGRWPEVVNMWELDGWDGLVRNFEVETGGGRDQDPALAAWWAEAASLRRGGVDRIMVPDEASRSIEELCAAGVRGAVYAHELLATPPDGAREVLEGVRIHGERAAADLGAELVGAFRTAMRADDECLLLWALPSWSAWAGYEQAWEPKHALAGWRKWLRSRDVTWQRTLLVDSALAPLRTGRQPQVEDRRPLEEIR